MRNVSANGVSVRAIDYIELCVDCLLLPFISSYISLSFCLSLSLSISLPLSPSLLATISLFLFNRLTRRDNLHITLNSTSTIFQTYQRGFSRICFEHVLRLPLVCELKRLVWFHAMKYVLFNS